MRWSDYVADLPAGAQERLVNGLLLGFRHLQGALDAASAGMLVGKVLAELAAAYEVLHEVLQLLQSDVMPAAVDEMLRHPMVVGRLAVPWRRALDAELKRVEQELRAAADAVVADANVAVVQGYLVAALTAMLRVRQSLATEDRSEPQTA